MSFLLFFIGKMCSGFVHFTIMVSAPPYFSRFWHSNKDLGISFSISRPFKWLRIDWYVSLLSVYLTDIARDLTSFSTPPTFIHYAPRLIVLTITQLFMYISPFYYLRLFLHNIYFVIMIWRVYTQFSDDICACSYFIQQWCW